MFPQVFLFELKQRLKSPVIWVLAALLAIKTISDMMGGEWQGLAGGGVPRNAPYAIYLVCVYATFWTVVFGAGLMTAPLLRDSQTRMAPLVNSSRVSSGGYFWGKFLASLIGLSIVMLGVVIGIASIPVVESLFHLVPAVQLMPTPWLHVLSAWLIWVLPGCVIYGSIHFALASLTGRTLPSYGLAVLSMAIFTMFFVAFSGVSGTRLFWLEVLDPMGHHTATSQLTLWSVAERSRRFMEATPALLLNRLLYVGGGLFFLLIARWRFSLAALVAKVKALTGRSRRIASEPNEAFHAVARSTNPKVANVQGGLHALRVAWYLAIRELKITWSGTAFRIIVGAIILLGFLGARFGSADYYTQPEQHVLPAAQYLLELVGKQMFLMLVMAGVYFGSEMLARDRTARMAILVDTAPVSTNTLAGARWLGVTMLSLTLAPLASLTTVLFQLFNGYREHFPAHSLRSFLQMAPQVIVYCWLAMAIYSFTRSKIASQSISIFLLLFFAILHSINAIEQHFFVLGLPVDLVFSDFRVMAASNARHLSFDAWYFGIAGVLVVIAAWLWPRGTETQLFKRLFVARQSLTWPSLAFLVLSVISLVLGGTTAWREIHLRHEFRNVKQGRDDAANYEKQYAETISWPHPQIESLKLKVTIDPELKQMRYDGVWTLANTDKRPMDRLYIEMPEDADPVQLSSSDRGMKPQSWDAVNRVGIWHLTPALQPGQRLDLQMRSSVRFHGFEEKPFEGTMGDDTAWFKSTYLPRFGYDRTREIDSPTHRNEYGLGPRSARQILPDRLASNADAGWVDIDLSVSLPATWTAVANGVKTGETLNGSAITLHFEAKHVPLAVQFVAGKLTTHQVLLNSVNGRQIPLTLAFHPGHQENVERMTTILRDAFVEFERRFGPCPAGAISLGEIPQYQEDTEPASLTQVQSVGGMIAMPERLGWLHNYRTQPSRDWLTFVLAQELAHSWWVDGVGAEEGPGSALIDEGVPTLMGLVMIEEFHGEKAADDYASILQDRLRRRMAREGSAQPTILTTNFEDYAGMQAALVLFEERQKTRNNTFDRLLGKTWRDENEKRPLSPSNFESEMELSSTAGIVSPHY